MNESSSSLTFKHFVTLLDSQTNYRWSFQRQLDRDAYLLQAVVPGSIDSEAIGTERATRQLYHAETNLTGQDLFYAEKESLEALYRFVLNSAWIVAEKLHELSGVPPTDSGRDFTELLEKPEDNAPLPEVPKIIGYDFTHRTD